MKRSKHSLSNYKLFTCNQGEIIPCGLTEVIPGDTIQQATSALIRVSPLVAPVMHPVHVKISHYFVPTRIIWEDWEDFITGGEDGLNASVYPTITFGGGTGAAVNSLADYMGIPTGVNNLEVSALPFRAYAAIYNEHVRNTDLQTALVIDKTSGPDSTTSTALCMSNWEKDYFTAASTDTQLGSEVSLPLGTSAPVATDAAYGETLGISSTVGSAMKRMVTAGGPADAVTLLDAAPTTGADLYANLQTATAATINQLREAMALQKYAEARQKYGSRYTEYLRYLGIKSADSRLQRPEYLGGGRQTIQFSEILQTGVDSTDAGVGNLAGHGIAAMRSNKYRRFFEEHGYVISLMTVQPKTIYHQGLPRTWNRRTKEDFFTRELQNIGMQEVLNKELYAAHTTPEGIFGYQNRYDCYRRNVNSVSGEFRTGAGLEHWHMARTFSSDPALNSSFITSSPTNRIYASTTNDQIYVMANHSIQARRMISKTGNPGGI